MPVKLNLEDRLNEPAPASYSNEAIELMRALNKHQSETGEAVTKPRQVFRVLLDEKGFSRAGESDRNARTIEFIETVRSHLITVKRRSPSYDEVLDTMRSLGYSRSS